MLDLYCTSKSAISKNCDSNSTSIQEVDISNSTTAEAPLHHRANYSDKVLSFVDTVTRHLAPDTEQRGGGRCDHQNTVLITAATTTILNTLAFLMVRIVCAGRRRVDAEQQDNYFQSRENLIEADEDKEDNSDSPIVRNIRVKDLNVKSPYEYI